MKEVRGTIWAVLGAVVAAWVILGVFYVDDAPANLLFDIATVGTFCSATLVLLVYTALGLTGPVKWWRNDVGTIVMLAAVALMPVSGPLAWAVIWKHGMLNTPVAVWTELGGWYLAWAATLAFGLLAARVRAARVRQDQADTPPEAP